LGSGVPGSGFQIPGPGFRVSGWFRVSGFGFQVSGSGLNHEDVVARAIDEGHVPEQLPLALAARLVRAAGARLHLVPADKGGLLLLLLYYSQA